MLGDNYEASKTLFEFASERGIPFIYASSAAVYGAGPGVPRGPRVRAAAQPVRLVEAALRPLAAAAPARPASQVVGLRYFNVYGPARATRATWRASPGSTTCSCAKATSCACFEGTDGFADGEQRRDFVYVGDVVAVNLWFLAHPAVSGIYNVGSGRAQSFNDVARSVIAHHGRGKIQYVPFPEKLRGSYQSHTCANLTQLRRSGCDTPFLSVEEGVSRYLKEIASRP